MLLVVGAAAGGYFSPYRSQFDISDALAEIKYYETATPKDLMDRLVQSYSKSEEAGQRIAKVDPDLLIQQLRVARRLLNENLASDSHIPLAIDETIFRMNRYPMALYPVEEFLRETDRTPIYLSYDESQPTQKKLRAAKAAFYEKLAAYVVEHRAERPNWEKRKQVAYVNLLHIVIHEWSFNENNDRQRLTDLDKRFGELLGDQV